MATVERHRDRGARRGARLIAELGAALRDARLNAGLSLDDLARHAGSSRSAVSRVELGHSPGVALADVAVLASVLGLELSARLYPLDAPVRDAAHLALLGRLRAIAAPGFAWRYERTVSISGDLRAVDAVLRSGRLRIGIEAETRLRDVQAVLRRCAVKRRDLPLDRLILVIAETRSNRAAIAAAGPVLQAEFPIGPRRMMHALRTGTDPGGDGYVVI